MATTILLKGIPDKLYEQLKACAETNRRSLSAQAITCLETLLLPCKTTALEHAAKASEIRKALKQGAFKPAELDRFKRAGRA